MTCHIVFNDISYNITLPRHVTPFLSSPMINAFCRKIDKRDVNYEKSKNMIFQKLLILNTFNIIIPLVYLWKSKITPEVKPFDRFTKDTSFKKFPHGRPYVQCTATNSFARWLVISLPLPTTRKYWVSY